MRKKIVALVLLVVMCLSMFTGCSKGIEGTWVLKEEYEKDGTRISSKQLEEEGVSEGYEIHGSIVMYYADIKGFSKPVNIEYVLEDLGNNQYNFNLPSGTTIITATIEGNTMTYEFDSGDGGIKMVFKKKMFS